MPIIPPKLQPGDEIRVIAPSRSLGIIVPEIIATAQKKLEAEGFHVTFGEHVSEKDIMNSSPVASRVADLHAAFADKNVKAILTVIGGFNSNQLLPYLDYDLIKNNPKIICGYSDITALANAITAKTGLVTYSGPHFSTWAMKQEFNYNCEYFKKCLLQSEPFEVTASPTWSDDAWYKDQVNRNIAPNEGYTVLHTGEAEGTIIGGNLCTLNLLQGTPFMPDLTDTVIFIEDDDMSGNLFDVEFDRNLQSLIHQPGFSKVRGLVIGRFQKKSEMTLEKLRYIIETKIELRNIPVIANVDFGHTNPMITFPIGGTVHVNARGEKVTLEIIKH